MMGARGDHRHEAGRGAVSIDEAARALGCKPASAAARLYHLGYGKKCAECGGSGLPTRRGDSACGGCGGLKIVLAGLTRAQLAEAKGRAEAGELETYFDAQRRAREVRRLPAVIERLLDQSPVYHTCLKGPGKPFINTELGRRFLTLCSIYQRALALADSLACGAVGLEEAGRESEELLASARASDMSAEEIREAGARNDACNDADRGRRPSRNETHAR